MELILSDPESVQVGKLARRKPFAPRPREYYDQGEDRCEKPAFHIMFV